MSDATVRDPYLDRSEQEGLEDEEDDFHLDDQNRVRSSSAKGSLVI